MTSNIAHSPVAALGGRLLGSNWYRSRQCSFMVERAQSRDRFSRRVVSRESHVTRESCLPKYGPQLKSYIKHYYRPHVLRPYTTPVSRPSALWVAHSTCRALYEARTGARLSRLLRGWRTCGQRDRGPARACHGPLRRWRGCRAVSRPSSSATNVPPLPSTAEADPRDVSSKARSAFLLSARG